MRKFLFPILLITSLFAREYIAIIDFEGIGVSTDNAKTLTQRLTSEMIALEVYQVLERSEMKRLLEEQKFQYSGCVDLKCAVEVGKLLGAKYMVVGNISKLGNAYSVDSRLISVESGESYVSAKYTLQGNIESLLIDGMKSIAYQLCELPYTATEQITQDVNLTNSTSNDNLWEEFWEVTAKVRTKPANVTRKDSTYKLWSSFSPTVGFDKYFSKYQMFHSSGSADVQDFYFALRWYSPTKIINKKAQLVFDITYRYLYMRTTGSVFAQRYSILGSHLSIFPIPSIEIRPGINLFLTNPYVTANTSMKEIIWGVDVDYHLPIKIGFAKPIINLGYNTDNYSMNLYLGLYLKLN